MRLFVVLFAVDRVHISRGDNARGKGHNRNSENRRKHSDYFFRGGYGVNVTISNGAFKSAGRVPAMACRAGRMIKRREVPPFLYFFAFIFLSQIAILILVWHTPIKGGVKQ